MDNPMKYFAAVMVFLGKVVTFVAFVLLINVLVNQVGVDSSYWASGSVAAVLSGLHHFPAAKYVIGTIKSGEFDERFGK